jgi:transcriptional regulator with XRE-family HTH domain
MALNIFDRILNSIPQNEERESNISFRIAQRIDFLMRQKQISKSDLARGMNKEPAQISRWMSGNHNFTIKTMAELEVYFGEPILISPTAHEEIAEYTQYVNNQKKVPILLRKTL